MGCVEVSAVASLLGWLHAFPPKPSQLRRSDAGDRTCHAEQGASPRGNATAQSRDDEASEALGHGGLHGTLRRMEESVQQVEGDVPADALAGRGTSEIERLLVADWEVEL